MTVDEIMREAMALDAESRAYIAHELLSSLESLSEAEVESLWIAEAQRRSADVKAGRAQTLSAHESLTHARAARGDRAKFERAMGKVPDVEPDEADS